ncbi:hypothetical protein CRH03_14445 [Clostridium sp. HMb25]|nr:hypothetical protein CRH03_14445 [Clostridium sp. HMb25]
MYFITTKRMLEVCFSAHPNIQYRTFLFKRILLLLNKNRSAENPASRILSCLLIQNLSSYSRKEPCRDPSLTIPAQALFI